MDAERIPESPAPRPRRIWPLVVAGLLAIATVVLMGTGLGLRVVGSIAAIALPLVALRAWFGPWWRTSHDPVAGAGWVVAALGLFASLVLLGPFLFMLALTLLTGAS